MSKIPVVSGKRTIKALKKLGFIKLGQKGSHVKLQRIIDGRRQVVIVPDHRELKRGTLRNGILKPIGLEVGEFIKLLR